MDVESSATLYKSVAIVLILCLLRDISVPELLYILNKVFCDVYGDYVFETYPN